MTVLTAQHLAGGYGPREVVHDTTLAVPAGSCLAILGPNGAGKSTLLRLLAGILEPRRGTVTLKGTPLARRTRREIARIIGFVPQSVSFAFPLTVEEIVLQARAPHLGPWRPPGRRDHDLAHQALMQVGLGGKEREPVTRLSGGERQRVLLARALAGQPEVLLLDEPAASLDVLHQLALLETLTRSMASGCGVVLVAHDWNLALRAAGTVLVMDSGRAVAHGDPHELPLAEILERVFQVKVAEVPGPDGCPVFLPTRPSIRVHNEHDRGIDP